MRSSIGNRSRERRLWAIGGEPYDAEAATQRADRHAREFAQAIAARLAAFRERRGKPGLVTFAVDTELLGHWWSEGPAWLEGVVRPGRRRTAFAS